MAMLVDGDMYKNPHYRTEGYTRPGNLFSIQDTRVKVRDSRTFIHSLTTHLAPAGLRKTEIHRPHTFCLEELPTDWGEKSLHGRREPMQSHIHNK